MTASVGQAQSAQAPLALTFPVADVHRLESKHVGASFDVRVLLPPTIPGENRRFPVVYMTDASGGAVVSDTMLRLLMLSDTPRFITVGIGYPGAPSYFQTMVVRQRDLTPVSDPGERTDAPFGGTLAPAIRSGRAAQFLDFIRDELMPFIDARYPTIPSERVYAGHSLGGLFGCYTMFTRPDTFNRYIIGSPSLNWGGDSTFNLERDYATSHRDLQARVFLGVGALEDSADNPMLRNVRRLESLLRERSYPGLTLTTQVFQDETHLSVWSTNLLRGLITVFGRPPADETPVALLRKTGAAPPR
jgi:predicted alpha/beta superfamily hydrolase